MSRYIGSPYLCEFIILQLDDLFQFKEVELSNNRISSISLPKKVFFPSIVNRNSLFTTHVNLQNNPISCASKQNLTHFTKYLQLDDGNSILEIDASSTNCPEPPSFICPKKCKCFILPKHETLSIDCSDSNLLEVPDNVTFPQHLLLWPHFKIHQLLVDFKNNQISKFLKNPKYDIVTDLNLANNNLTEISWVPSQIKVRMRFCNILISNCFLL